jgi:hypothetical protein
MGVSSLQLVQALPDVAEALRIDTHARVIIFGDPHDNVHHIREAAAAAAALLDGVVDLGGNDELPGIIAQQFEDRILDVALGDHIAVADQHFARPAPGRVWSDVQGQGGYRGS